MVTAGPGASFRHLSLRAFSHFGSHAMPSRTLFDIPQIRPPKIIPPLKEWREAMLHGQSYEDLIKAKAERLAKARFRRERRKAREAVANAEWETAAEKVASGIQRMWRAKIAQRRIQDMLDQVYEKVYDEATGGYYYYNKVTCTTSWEKPKLLRHEMEGVY